MLSETLEKSGDKKSFKIEVRSAAKILTLSAYLNVKRGLRQPILFDLFYLVVPEFESVCTLGRHEFNSVRSKM